MSTENGALNTSWVDIIAQAAEKGEERMYKRIYANPPIIYMIGGFRANKSHFLTRHKQMVK